MPVPKLCRYAEWPTRCSQRWQISLPLQPRGDLDQASLTAIRLVPPPGKLDKTYASSLIRVFPPIIWKRDVIH